MTLQRPLLAVPRAETPEERGRRGTRLLVALMILAVAVVAALAFWDERRESAAALDDFAEEQATLAGSVAAELAIRLAELHRDARVHAGDREARALYPKLLEGAARLERPGVVRLLLLGPDDALLRGTDGDVLDCPPVQRAIASARTSVWLDRPEAAALGLPPRRAAAGLARIDAAPLGRWAVAVVTSAVRVRDREQRAALRLALGVILAAGLVFAFGSEALRRQRRALLLQRELALAALGRERDAELSTATRAATLGTLAMGIAHEVSTPLGVIAGRAEQLLPKVEGDERAARSVRAILDQAERIRRVVRAFLDLVRGGAPALGDTPPAAVVEGAVALVEHRLSAAGVALEKRVAPDLPAIHGDAAMLQQALVNLLLNAGDACVRDGRVVVSVSRDEDQVIFTVTDDGRGITPEEAARATEPFFTTKAPGLGSGLGLAIANEIVKLHRGTLTLEPATPRGTRAELRVPVPTEQTHAAA